MLSSFQGMREWVPVVKLGLGSSASTGFRSGMVSPHDGARETEQEQTRERSYVSFLPSVVAQVTPDSSLM